MKVLITGTNGFIGKNVFNKLSENQKRLSIDNFICLDRDFLQKSDWKETLELYVKEVDVIFHIGAISDTALHDSTEMLLCNYLFSKELFDYSELYNKKVIYSSSAACYGNGDGIPNNIYGWSKLLAENYGYSKCTNFVSLRYFNVYGPGEDHKGSKEYKQNMSSIAFQSWVRGGMKLFPKKPRRDFVFIDDVVSANITAISSPKGIYEVGSGVARTFESILDNLELPYTYHSEDKIPEWYQFYTKSDETKWLPNWTPKYNLERGIKKYKEYLNK